MNCKHRRRYSAHREYLIRPRFSKQSVDAWNSNDLEAVLEHFHDEVVFTAPMAAQLQPEAAGVVRGKPALRRYWTQALQQIPDLRFVINSIYHGIDTIVIAYRNKDNKLVSEVLRFSGDLVTERSNSQILWTAGPAGGGHRGQQ